MKTKLSLLFVLLILAVTFAQAQSKKDVENNLNRCTITKDSIQDLFTGLSETYDSINKVCIAYETMYNAIKDDVILYAFDPTNMSVLIDSLQIEKSSAFAITLNDSLSIIQQENDELKATIEGMAKDNEDNSKWVNDLKQLKELLDAEIITQEEFDTKKAVLLEKF